MKTKKDLADLDADAANTAQAFGIGPKITEEDCRRTLENAPSRVFASVAYVERADDGKILVVWNKRYGKWAMPGGKVEDGEDSIVALKREVLEETGADVIGYCLTYEGHHGESVESARGSYVYVYTVQIFGTPREREPGCPVTWFTRDEFLKWGIASEFYTKMFKALDALGSHQ